MLTAANYRNEPPARSQTFTFAGRQLVERSTWAPTWVERALLWGAAVLGWPSRALTRAHGRRFDRAHPAQTRYVAALVAAFDEPPARPRRLDADHDVEGLAHAVGYPLDDPFKDAGGDTPDAA